MSFAVPNLVMVGPLASFFSSSVIVLVIFGFDQNFSKTAPWIHFWRDRPIEAANTPLWLSVCAVCLGCDFHLPIFHRLIFGVHQTQTLQRTQNR
jgi:hypothetical protein